MFALILLRSGVGLLMDIFHQVLTKLSACDMSVFSFLDDNFNKYQWIFTRLGICIALILWRSVLRLLMGKLSIFMPRHMIVSRWLSVCLSVGL